MVEQMCPMVGCLLTGMGNSSYLATVVSSDALPRQQRTCRQLPLYGQSKHLLGQPHVTYGAGSRLLVSRVVNGSYCLIWRPKVTDRTLVHGLCQPTRDHVSGTKGRSRVAEFCRSSSSKPANTALLLSVPSIEGIKGSSRAFTSSSVHAQENLVLLALTATRSNYGGDLN